MLSLHLCFRTLDAWDISLALDAWFKNQEDITRAFLTLSDSKGLEQLQKVCII